MMSGELPPAYLVYTTGTGFMPNIEGIPQAMKGLATIFMLALLTGNSPTMYIAMELLDFCLDKCNAC